jgi:hypothetical protein
MSTNHRKKEREKNKEKRQGRRRRYMQRGEEFDLEIWAKQWSIETDTIF